MANKKNEEEDLLTLGEARKEIEQEEVHNKKQVVPVIMMIVGFLLMIVGIFYNDIIAFINPKEEKTTVKSNYEDVKNKLECMKEDEDETTGVKTITSYTFNFKSRKLTSYEEKIVLRSIKDSDIGPNNIKVMATKYDENISKFSNIDGIEITNNLSSNKYLININIDLEKLDKTKVPVDDKINVISNKDDEYKEVKKKMVTEIHLSCD